MQRDAMTSSAGRVNTCDAFRTVSRRMHCHPAERGAALIVAVAIMTILLAIALTFFTVSRVELKTSTNVENTVRADLLADAANAIAESFLNYDKIAHPTYTSLDHAWRTYFNGAWVVGKEWAFGNTGKTLQGGAVPHVFFTNEDAGNVASTAAFEKQGGGGTGHLYVPRAEGAAPVTWTGNYAFDQNPWVISNLGPVPPAFQVHDWADVDNDGDGLRDSMWIPLVADVFAGAVQDNYTDDASLLIDDTYPPDYAKLRAAAGTWDIEDVGDGVDNDLDGPDMELGLPMQIHPADWQALSNDRRKEQAQTYYRSVGTDEANENTVFFYWGGNDGRDNNGNNLVDNADPLEAHWFLTAPICAANGQYLVLHNVNLPDAPGDTNTTSFDVNTSPVLQWPDATTTSGLIQQLNDKQHRWVDVTDNDYDLIVNKHTEYWTPNPDLYDINIHATALSYEYVKEKDASGAIRMHYLDKAASKPATGSGTALQNYFDQINTANDHANDACVPGVAMPNLYPDYQFDNLHGVHEIAPYYLRETGVAVPDWRIKTTGEPVCTVAGRAAILISDEASKVNLNAAGAYSFDRRALNVASDSPADAVDLATARASTYYWPPAFSAGRNPYEYSTVFMPAIAGDDSDGIGRSHKLWNLAMGAPWGSLKTGPLDKPGLVASSANLADEYVPDTTLPGYGFVDDDANALALAMDGLDNNGNGLVDEGINDGTYLTSEQVKAAVAFGESRSFFGEDNATSQLTDTEKAQIVYQDYLGYLEGVDEPGEFQRRRPLRNLVAEGRVPKADGTSYENKAVDGSGTPGAFGMLGDHVLKTRDEVKRIVRNETGTNADTFYNNVKNLITLHSTDLNNRFQETTWVEGNELTDPNRLWNSGKRPQGLRLDYNYATPKQIAQVFRDDWGMVSPIALTAQTLSYGDTLATDDINYLPREFARGLQQEGVNVSIYYDKGTQQYMTPFNFQYASDTGQAIVPSMYKADPYLRALQLGANLHDMCDADYARSTTSMQTKDIWWDHMQMISGSQTAAEVTATGDQKTIKYTVAGNEGIRITEMMVRPVRRVEAEMIMWDDMTDQYGNRVMSSLWPSYFEQAFNPDLVSNWSNDQNDYLEFLMTRSDMKTMVDQVNQPTGTRQMSPVNTASTWSADLFWPVPTVPTSSTIPLGNPCLGTFAEGSGVAIPQLGAGTARSTQMRFLELRDKADAKVTANGGTAPVEHWPNIMEFTFRPSIALPPGRYYLKINTNDYLGRPTVTGPHATTADTDGSSTTSAWPAWYTSNKDQFRIAIKYVSKKTTKMTERINGRDRTLSVGSTSILRDVANGFAVSATNGDEFYTFTDADPDNPVNQYWKDYWEYYWRAPSDYLHPSPTNLGIGPVLAAQSLKPADRLSSVTGLGDGLISYVEARDLIPALPKALFDEYDANTDGFIDLQTEGCATRDSDHGGIPTGWVFVPSLDDELALDDPDTTSTTELATMPETLTPAATKSTYTDVMALRAGYGQDSGFTVMIPPYADPEAHPSNVDDYQVELHIAICMGGGDPLSYDSSTLPRLSINSFEFSQEPDHEWVEIENTTGHDVDISGWELAVGGVDGNGDLATADKTVMKVPDVWVDSEGVSHHTVLPGRTSLYESSNANDLSYKTDHANPRMILAVNAFDYFAHKRNAYSAYDRSNLLFRNGIGLEGGVSYDDEDTDSVVWDGFGLLSTGAYADVRGVTVPEIPLAQDTDSGALPQELTLDNGSTVLNQREDGKMFRRHPDLLPVVQLEIEGLTGVGDIPVGSASDSTKISASLKDIAGWVLGGGVLPDYPEHDGIDNDDDNTILNADKVDNNGNVLRLSDDDLDNDGDSSVDESGEGIASGLDETNEGIDEGRNWMDATHGTTSGVFAPNPAPGAFDMLSPGYESAFFEWLYDPADPAVTSAAIPAYMGNQVEADTAVTPATPPDPPRWKEFVERRFYPGDNVVISLFQGNHKLRRVADRVTYTERDVVNRCVDDAVNILSWLDDEGKVCWQSSTLYDKAFGAHVDLYLSWLPDDTMGADFYRTLERKHCALYNGDRFGTSNRWEATDGNYDDWAHDPVLYRPLQGVGPGVPTWGEMMAPDAQRFAGTPFQPNAAYDREFDSNEFDYPLWDDTGDALVVTDNAVTYRQWGDAGYVARATELAAGLATVKQPDRAFTSIGDTMSLPYVELHENYTLYDNEYGAYYPEVRAYNYDGSTNASTGYTLPGLAREEVLRVRLGQVYPPSPDRFLEAAGLTIDSPSSDLMPAVMGAAAFDPIRLSCGRADFYLLNPDNDSGMLGNQFNDNVSWEAATSTDSASKWTLPRIWRPVFLYPLASDLGRELNDHASDSAYASLGFFYRVAGLATPMNLPVTTSFENYFLLNKPMVPAAAAAAEELWSRSPIQTRTAFYVSGNPNTFTATRQGEGETASSAAAQGVSEALFIWNADDGIEDGIYDLYIDTGGPLDTLVEANNAVIAAYQKANSTTNEPPDADQLLTPLGKGLCKLSALALPSDIIMSAEVFTDRNPTVREVKGKCWALGDNDVGPTRANLLRDTGTHTFGTVTKVLNSDSFGIKPGLTPDESGCMYYGTVKIENNYLALYLRNWSKSQVPCRFAGVILTPRDRTAGRVNVNTTETRAYFYQGGTVYWTPANFSQLYWRPFNTLMGLPGVVLDPIVNPLVNAGQFADPKDRFTNAIGGDPTAVPALPGLPAFNTNIASTSSANKVMDSVHLLTAGRSGSYPRLEGGIGWIDRQDARCYKSLDEIVSARSGFINGNRTDAGNVLYPLSTFNDACPYGTGVNPKLGAIKRFNDEQFRFSRLANMLTVRSDVFEIIATVQSGYGVDANGDGEINYRNNDEFIVTSEKKVRTVYER